MTGADTLDFARESIYLLLELSAPAMLTALVVEGFVYAFLPANAGEGSSLGIIHLLAGEISAVARAILHGGGEKEDAGIIDGYGKEETQEWQQQREFHRGDSLALGTPTEIQRNQAVLDIYLSGDLRRDAVH